MIAAGLVVALVGPRLQYDRYRAGESWPAYGKPLIPEPPRTPGRPWSETRRVLDGILWILGTASRWRQLPSPILPTRPVTAVTWNGSAPASG